MKRAAIVVKCTPMKPLFCALALLTMLAPALAQDAATAFDRERTRQEIPKTVTLDNGLLVTPVIVPYDDLGSMLDAQLWRFKIKPPAPDTFMQAQLEIRKTGEDIDKTYAFGFGFSEEIELTFGMMPRGGSVFESADFWKVHFVPRLLSGELLFSTVNGELQNPIKDFKWKTGESSGEDGAIARPLSNGDVVLKKYFGGTPEKPVVVELVLVLTKK